MFFRGTITDEWLKNNGTEEDRSAESADFLSEEFVYHYFSGDEVLEDGRTLADHIYRVRSLASKARCLTSDQIMDTLGTDDPHYGDGAYVTFHSNLGGAHKDIQRHHGIRVSQRSYRAYLRIKQTNRFHRVYQTGGVGYAHPVGTVEPGQHIFIEEPHEIKIIRLEHWDGTRWVSWRPT